MKPLRCSVLSGNAEKKNPPLTLEVADSFFSRFRGLMLRKTLPPGHGLLLEPCNSIHMCFMRFAIDAVYIDREYRVVKVVTGLRPWIGLSLCLHAAGVIELPAHTAMRYGIVRGAQLEMVDAVGTGAI